MDSSAGRTSLAQQLTGGDKSRLEAYAPLFDIEFAHMADGRCRLRLQSPGRPDEELDLPETRAYLRLLAELCSRTVRWIYFHPGESALQSFMGQTDAKIRRVATLYARWKNDGFPT